MGGTPENITLMAGTGEPPMHESSVRSHVEFVSEIPDQRTNTAGNKMLVGAILRCILIMKRYFQGEEGILRKDGSMRADYDNRNKRVNNF